MHLTPRVQGEDHMSVFNLLIACFLLLAPHARGEVCPGGFTPTFADIIFALENSNIVGSPQFTTVKNAIAQSVTELGRYIAPGKLRVGVASYGADVCTTANPCSAFLDYPTLVSNFVSGLTYSGQSGPSVQTLITGYVAGTLLPQLRANTPAILVVFTSSDTYNQSPSLAALSSWSPYLSVYTVDVGGNTTTSNIAKAIASNLAQNAVVNAAWASSGTALADALICPGVCLCSVVCACLM